MANALQSVVFTVIWRGLSEHWSKDEPVDENEESEGIAEAEHIDAA